jgi:hypothetical protein
VWIHSYPCVELTPHLWVPQRISYDKVGGIALAAFYGEQVVYELHSVYADASLTGVSFAKAAPRPKRGLSAP